MKTESPGPAPRDRFEDISALGAPEPAIVGPHPKLEPDDLRHRRFLVWGRKLRLSAPIDWCHDDEGRSWRFQLQTLSWLRPAVDRHAETGDPEALKALQEIALDWTRQHSPDRDDLSEFAWYDMAVGLRAPYLAYALRAGLNEQTLDEQQASDLWAAAERHGRELADPANYSAGNNHGLFQDEGLYLLTKQLPTLPNAPKWSELAQQRLLTTLRETVDFDEGAHLEHSPGYQFAICSMVERLCGYPGMPRELAELLVRMRRTAALHVTPHGRLLQLGDTDDVAAPEWAVEAADEVRGLHTRFAAGQAFVREGDSYLAVTSGHHSRAHKQADDTSFILIEDGQVVVGDTGRWGYYEHDQERLYARSNRAHNVLVVDDRDLSWKKSRPYGSGLEATGAGEGWYALVVSNRLLRNQGVRHRRLFLYRPGAMLVVADEVHSWRRHDYARYWHLGPGFRATLGEGRIEFAAGVLTGSIVDTAPDSKPGLVSERTVPSLLGWSYPADRERVPVHTAAFRTRGRRRLDTSCLILGTVPLTAQTTATSDGYAVELSDGRVVTVIRGSERSLICREARSPK